MDIVLKQIGETNKMAQKQIMYKQVILDYFKDFSRNLHAKKNTLGICIVYMSTPAIWSIFGSKNGIEQLDKNWLIGIPVLFAIISSSFHKVSLPFMMYLIPYSQKQREEYIQKMLTVKIAVPVIFGCLSDIAAISFGTVSCYAVILQMTGILFIAYTCGALCDYDIIFESKNRPVYGEVRTWCSILLILCYMGSPILFAVCVDHISKTEFWVIMILMILILLPIAAMIHKHWKAIRSNFADYEMTIKILNIR